MRLFRLALAQVNPTVGDIQGNTRLTLDYIQRAKTLGADMIAFPEMCVTGYPPEDLLYKTAFIRDNIRAVREIASHATDIAVVAGFADAQGNELYNAAALMADGKLLHVYHKMFLPTYGVFDEDRYFHAGRQAPVYTVNGVRVGVNICEDLWYSSGPIAIQRDAGAEVVVTINASPFHAGKAAYRQRMVATRASDNLLYVAYLNAVGGQDELVFDGGTVVADQNGETIARAPQFEESLLVVDLDADALLPSRLREPRPRKERPSLREIGEPVSIDVPPFTPVKKPLREPGIARLCDPHEEVYRALVTGTRDYLGKNGFEKAVVGLSGGIDSSLVACVAVDALGAENVLGVTMPSRYSSEGSVGNSASLAKTLGIEMWTVPIEAAFSAYLSMIEKPFEGMQPDATEENLQARIRGNILMAVSNKLGHIVLTTGNKTEMSVGYATLYGDMAGGFAVIKDVPKMLVYDLARWRNENGTPSNPVPESVFTKPPSAELRPDQTDQDSLPPYEDLDLLLRAYVEEDRSFDEIVALGFDEETVRTVMRMVDRAEYKRRQAAPGVKITPRAFGKDRRMPIVNKYTGY